MGVALAGKASGGGGAKGSGMGIASARSGPGVDAVNTWAGVAWELLRVAGRG